MSNRIQIKGNNEFTVDFSRTNQSDQLIPIESCIYLKRHFLWWIIPKSPTGEHIFKVELTKSGGLELYPNKKAVKLSVYGSEFGDEVKVDINTRKVPVYLLFCPDAVKDCKGKLDNEDNRHYDVEFAISVSEAKNGKVKIDREKVKIRVNIADFKPVPDMKIDLSKSNLTYQGHGNCPKSQLIGHLKVKHGAAMTCAPDITNLKLQVKAYLKRGDALIEKKGLVSLGDVTQKQVTLMDDNTCEIKELCVHGESFELPLLWHMNQIDNPSHEDCYVIKVTDNGGYLYDGCNRLVEIPQPQAQAELVLKRNRELTKLGVEFAVGNKSMDITNNGYVDCGLQILRPDFVTELTLKFANQAMAEDRNRANASVILRNIEQLNPTNEDSERVVPVSECGSLGDVLRLKSSTSLAPITKLKYNECVILGTTLSLDNICNIRFTDSSSVAQIDIPISFDCYIDADGTYYFEKDEAKLNALPFQHFSKMISFKLQIDPNPEWLSVDFGTSAVVASRAAQLNMNREALDKAIVDLKSKKTKLLQKAYTDKNLRGDANDENGNLISSVACLNITNDGNFESLRIDEHFGKYPLWFSPSQAMLSRNRDRQLPCLKTLMGYEYLPDIFTSNDKTTFKYKKNGKEIHLWEGNRKTELQRVDVVFELLYKQLFHHYFRSDSSDLNKLVLTVPNTYTPIHVRKLKQLARKILTNLYPEHLCTVSESDAVACYYIANSAFFYANSTDEVVSSTLKQQLRTKERVLVFDMGAGTLDLTYFVKNYDEQKEVQKYSIDILGKMGVNKAGNYLDYLLAALLIVAMGENKIITGSVADFVNYMLLDKEEADSLGVQSRDRIALKNYVKYSLKPLLNDSEAILPDLKVGDKVYSLSTSNLRVKDIVTSDAYQNYLDECTDKVLTSFAQLFGKSGVLDVDVVIFSGRSTQLQAIRDKVQDSIKVISPSTASDILFADITNNHFSRNALLKKEQDCSLLKTVVTYGALAYASMYNLEGSDFCLHGKPYYATYGLVLHTNDSYNPYVWHPMISPNMPMTSEGIESKLVIPNMANIVAVDLVQSYSSQTAEDYRRGNKDMISVLTQIATNSMVNKHSFDLVLRNPETCPNQLLELYLDGSKQVLNPHDDFDNYALRQSLWPVVFK